MMRKVLISILFVMLISSLVKANSIDDFIGESDSLWIASAELQVGITSKGVVPFWMRSNQYGSIPASGASTSLIGAFYKKYKKGNTPDNFSYFDWGLDFQGRGNLAHKSSAQLIEYNLKAKWWIVEARLGRSKDVIGLNGDTSLTSGNFAVSGNALGIPKFELRIPDYYRLPIFGGLISLKGNIAHGWLGKREHNPTSFLIPSNDYYLDTYYHGKSFYGRIGKENWKINLYGGINHQAHWGNEKEIYGDLFLLSPLETFNYVFWGKPYKSKGIGSSKIGNQMGSLDVGMSIDVKNIRLLGYRQNFYDIGAISKLANIKDGLNGISLRNLNYLKTNNKKFDWESILLEYFYSKDQAGYPWSRPTASGNEDYYNNSYYFQGWSYKGRGIGSPLIIMSNEARDGQVSNPVKYFISNRVSAIHFGTKFWLYNTDVMLKLTHAKHFGNFSTSQWGTSLGKVFYEPYGLFVPVDQTSVYLSLSRSYKRLFDYSLVFAGDRGEMLKESNGIYLSLKKNW